MAAKIIILKNGMIYINDNLVEKDLLISAGKIKKIEENISSENAKVIDCSGKIILPGIIDTHVHFREPGMEYKEDFRTGSMAAAAGGITTIFDMPNTRPPTLTVKDLKQKRKLAKEKCLVNYGFHFGSAVDNLEEIKKAQKISCVASTKIFMNWSTGNMKIDDENSLMDIFKNSRIVAVHAEGEQVKKAVELARKTNNKLYLCHISAKEEIDYLKRNKTKNIFIEVTPHHLFLTEEQDNSFRTVKPKLKTAEDIKVLWQAIDSGLVDTIGSDHAPHTIEEKKSDNPPSGMPGEETLLPLMLDAVNKGRISLQELVELCSENPVKIFGIKNKGKIKEGFDADLTIVDMNLEKKVDESKLFTKCKWSAFKGKILKGWPVMTIVNGNVVFDNGKINDKVKGKEVRFA